MRYIELANYLFSIKDQKHAEFSGNLSNSSYITIGVKNPILRSIIKEHYKDTELCLEDFDNEIKRIPKTSRKSIF